MRFPSTAGVEQIPSCGQSFTRPAGSLSCTACQRNFPVFSSKHITIPLSPLILGLRRLPLLVPTKTLPSAITGPPYAFEPRSADHLMFFAAPSSTLHSVGTFFSNVFTMLRLGLPPNIGQLCSSAVFAGALRSSFERIDWADGTRNHKTRARITKVETAAKSRRRAG